MQYIKDPRMPQVRQLINSIFGKSTLLKNIDVLVTEQNSLVIIAMNTAIYEVPLLDCQPLPAVAFKYSDIMDIVEEDLCISDVILKEKMKQCYEFYLNSTLSIPMVAHDPELRGNEDFEYCLSAKAADGARFYKVRGTELYKSYMVPIFAGFPNLAKQDKIGISIYDFNDQYRHLLIVMDIYKKKINRNMKLYFKTINLM